MVTRALRYDYRKNIQVRALRSAAELHSDDIMRNGAPPNHRFPPIKNVASRHTIISLSGNLKKKDIIRASFLVSELMRQRRIFGKDL